MIMGDFNWVAAAEDRVNKMTGAFSGAEDVGEQRDAEDNLWRPAGLYEIRQPELTHESASAWSRLDRCYWNAHVVGQLDRNHLHGAGVGPSPIGPSGHRIWPPRAGSTRSRGHADPARDCSSRELAAPCCRCPPGAPG